MSSVRHLHLKKSYILPRAVPHRARYVPRVNTGCEASSVNDV